MRKSIVLIAALLALSMAGAPAFADTVLSTADYNSNEPGDFIIDSGSQNMVAASFQLNQATQITGVGGHFSQFSDGGTIFGAIVSATSLAAPPTASSANLGALSLSTAILTPDGSDQIGAMSVLLGPGSYYVIFGSGLFGTNGNSGLATGQTDNINSAVSLFQTIDGGNSWGTLGENDVRIVVQSSPVPVPLPAGLPLLAAGLLSLGAFIRRRQASI